MATTVGMPPLWSPRRSSWSNNNKKKKLAHVCCCQGNQITQLRIRRTTQTRTLPFALCLEDARNALENSIRELESPSTGHGILRLQVPFPQNVKALHWIQCQPESCSLLQPRIYFSPRNSPDSFLKTDSFTVAGVGSTVTFRGREPFSVKHWEMINRYLSETSPLIRAYGAMRFDPEAPPSPHWEEFGTFYFFIPQVELCEAGNYSLLAVNLAWGDDVSFEMAGQLLLTTLSSIIVHTTSPLGKVRVNSLSKKHTPDHYSWHSKMNHILEQLNGVTKTVMARETRLEIQGQVPPFTLLASLQEQNPFAYQFCLQLADGAAFIGNTPEQLFARDGLMVTSEAVAATRPRGVTSVDDHLIALDLLQSSKDHNEFHIVQEGVRKAMETVCKKVDMVMTKGIVKQPKVQHLCTRFVGELDDKHEEYDLLAALHPTAAVCGHPRETAKKAIAATESFDRGLYAGPVGWFGGQGSEFAVGIRSALITSTRAENRFPSKSRETNIMLFAGVGVVQGSDSAAEWQELELKTSQFESLLRPSKQLSNSANVNMLWASLIVEECCRLGVTCFCIAPGSRSSPLAEAAAANPRVSCVSCIDERTLAYFAVGYGRGARKPAAVVTTSGTSVSNLLPAVVEASQDSVPMLVLSADRPHELRDSGANQTINQVDHFGKFVRYHFDFPAATDEVPARMVLTTIDTAVFHATSDPHGPVHLNCPFREPLEAVPRNWDVKCLEGLTQWMQSSSPFTTYIPNFLDYGLLDVNSSSSQMVAVTDILASANRGLIVVGGLYHSESTWAAYKLAEHLNWPLVPDILSGFRLTSSKTVKIIHNFDQVLLSSKLQSSVAPDVILQIGSRITSKRLSKFLQECSPQAYILIEEHPHRHDPDHRLTHRIKCPVALFTRIVLKELATYMLPDHTYGSWLDHLSQTVRWKIFHELQMQVKLTEPAIARIVSASVPSDTAIFLGSSMPIRDVDMYADVFFCSRKPGDSSASGDDVFVPVIVTVAANRGASGIDGVISSAIGFAAGSKKRVTLLLGDLSFLHDTNGLMLLSGRDAQPPLTVVVVNNGGGGIFSLLPVADFMEEVAFRTLISTEHDVRLEKLCHAHRINHVYVKSKAELDQALRLSYSSSSHWIIEAESNMKDNAKFHRYLQDEMRCYLDRIFPILRRRITQPKKVITSVETFAYKFPLKYQLTTKFSESHSQAIYREGFLIQMLFSDNSSGLGEIAPLPGLHKEDLIDVQRQLYLLKQKLHNVEVTEDLALLDGSFSRWFTTFLGAQEKAIFPSVRTGIEMAILDSLGDSNKCTMLVLLTGEHKKSFDVRICGLINSQEAPSQVADIAWELVQDGYTTLKIKVGRRASPLEDAAAVIAVRERIGENIKIRVDANRKWTCSQALEFTNAVRECHLEYLEEPVGDLTTLRDFLGSTCVPVALDETIDENIHNYAQLLDTLPGDNLCFAVIKPSRVGGFEISNKLINLSLQRKLIPVVSSCFESSIALAAFVQFAAYIEDRNVGIPSVAQGLGTFLWTKQDLVEPDISQAVHEGRVNVSHAYLTPQLSSSLLKCDLNSRNIRNLTRTIKVGKWSFKFGILAAYGSTNSSKPVLVFLHGFLGSALDWLPLMTSLSVSFKCLAINIPGHGLEPWNSSATCGAKADPWGMELLVQALSSLLQVMIGSTHKVVLIGYSLGARIVLSMAVQNLDLIHAVVSISGSPGIAAKNDKEKRAVQDDKLANALRCVGLKEFVSTWYQKPLWKSFRNHPDFEAFKKVRASGHIENTEELSFTLSCLTIGRQQNNLDLLDNIKVPVLLVVGTLDSKFVSIAQHMKRKSPNLRLVQVDDCGHCLHIEAPLELLALLYNFIEGCHPVKI